MMRRNLTLNFQDNQLTDMKKQGIFYVHGSNSESFPGLCRFRALLSMEEMNSTGWFNKHGIHSGERGYSILSLHNNGPVSKGVSLNHVQNYQLSLKIYSSYGFRENNYPVLYGLGLGISLNIKVIEHPVSNGGINIDYIKAIYVPSQKVEDAKRKLFSLGRVGSLIRPLLGS